MIDRKASNFFALNDVYMIVSHPPAICLFTCAIAHILPIDYFTMRISLHIVFLFVTRLNITFFFIVRLTALFKNVNMLLEVSINKGDFSVPLLLVVSVDFDCFLFSCVFDAIRFPNVSIICIHWKIPPFYVFVGHVNHLVILDVSTFSGRCDIPSKIPDIATISLYVSHGNKSVCYFIQLASTKDLCIALCPLLMVLL